MQILTATGGRPWAWAMCERLMAAQTFDGPVHWVVVDDGPEAQLVHFERAGWRLEVIRPAPRWQPGQNTQARNLLAGLNSVDPYHPLAIIEDDDWYDSTWLQHVHEMLRRAELVGETRSRYYNLARRVGRDVGNVAHASLCATALRGRAVEALKRVCRLQAKFIDIHLWRTHRDKLLFSGHRVVGIKGLPGRPGIGGGHRPEFHGQADQDGQLLREWVGAEWAEQYLQAVQTVGQLEGVAV